MTELKPCPFCGRKVRMRKYPLWHDSHGYYGCYEYVIECENPQCGCHIKLSQNDTIYRNKEEAKRNAIKAWNRRAEG